MYIRHPPRWSRRSTNTWRLFGVVTLLLCVSIYFKGRYQNWVGRVWSYRGHGRDVSTSRLSASFHNSRIIGKATEAQHYLSDPDDDDDDTDDEVSEPASEGYNPKHDGYPFTDIGDDRDDYHEIYSLSRDDRKYYGIHMDGSTAYNANLLPHPTRVDMWLVVATHMLEWDAQSLSCAVGNLNGMLVCAEKPEPLPVVTSLESKCEGPDLNLAWVGHPGPRDARVFWGPDAPYIIYGTQSQVACLGMWIQDARELLPDYRVEAVSGSQLFHGPTELQRPKADQLKQTRATIEKNYFMFWDEHSTAYVHYDIWPNRSFAKLDMDGSVGEDLAPLAKKDRMCLLQVMPILNKNPLVRERIHQATNSLSITLCKRADPSCKPTNQNTLIMHIFQRQRQHENHNTYSPYTILFRQTAPFEIYAIAERPLWIHGRSLLTKNSGAARYMMHPDQIPENHAEMLYVTSISWKNHGQKYHGYLDDPVWVAFGKEDSQGGAIDVLAEDLVRELAICDDFP